MQDTTHVVQAVTDSTSHIAKTVNDVINVLASHLSVPAAHVWKVLVKQVYVDAYTWTGSFVATLVIFILMAVWCYKAWVRENENHSSDPYGSTVLSTILTAVFGVVTLILLYNMIPALAQMANPEYGAIQTIISAIHH